MEADSEPNMSRQAVKTQTFRNLAILVCLHPENTFDIKSRPKNNFQKDREVVRHFFRSIIINKPKNVGKIDSIL